MAWTSSPLPSRFPSCAFFISLVCDQRTNRNKRENHGIRPLPNLETKFVAANTLIRLPEMDQLALLPYRVHQIEAEIESLYHNHFSIQRRDQKLALQKRIKSLREELGKLLAESLGSSKKSQHIANWDPFDPQACSEFFDAHWMFGPSLADGFDIVFGNPPWGAGLSKEMKAQLKDTYPEIDSSTPNSFAYFVGAALKLAKSQVAYVLPDAILIKDYSKTRRLLRDVVSRVDWYLNTGIPEQARPFVYVEHDVCVLILDKTRSLDDCVITKHLYDANQGGHCVEERRIRKDKFILPQHGYCFNLLITEASYRLMTALERGTPLGEITQSHEGIHTGNCRDILFHKGQINPYCKPLFYGGRAGDQIDNYHSTHSGWFVDYRESIIDKEKGHYASLRDERIFKLPKIYITRTGNPIKAFFDRNTYASNNFFSLQFKDYEKNTEKNLKSILPLILSSVANFYIRNFAAPRLGNTYVETKIIHLDRVPVSDALLRKSDFFGLLTDLIIASIKFDLGTTTQFLEDLIDACVMECYFQEHMGERDLLFIDELIPHIADFNLDFSESLQREFILQLHDKLNAPSSKIRNRLLRISADSPDLLAVIKEGGKA
jgi:adenine-specific DNA-methyltransferase